MLRQMDEAFGENSSHASLPSHGCGGIETLENINYPGISASKAISEGLPQYSTTDDTWKGVYPLTHLNLQTLGRAENRNSHRAQRNRKNPLDRQGRAAYRGGSLNGGSSGQPRNNGSHEDGERGQGDEDPTADSRSDVSNNGPFACPYYKKDPLKHIACWSIGLTKPHYIKSHLLPFGCDNTFEGVECSFRAEGKAAIRAHQRNGCCPTAGLRPSAEEWRSITYQRNQIDACKGDWRKIYACLFGGEAKDAPSPYHTDFIEGTQSGMSWQPTTTFAQSREPTPSTTVLTQTITSETQEVTSPIQEVTAPIHATDVLAQSSLAMRQLIDLEQKSLQVLRPHMSDSEIDRIEGAYAQARLDLARDEYDNIRHPYQLGGFQIGATINGMATLSTVNSEPDSDESRFAGNV
ncbi:hypothetical protein BZA77DRAFT_345882 [Pyronema omphalodes]|nr:hypothetical protein BZA77DRAFT_345882 [Pyronema omphalodes]